MRARQDEKGIAMPSSEFTLMSELQASLNGEQLPSSRPKVGSTIGIRERILYAELSHSIVGAAIDVHRHLGPGQLESVYERALAHELGLRGIAIHRQVPIELEYKACEVGAFVADMIVDGKIIVELKTVAEFQSVHVAQVLGYLRATELRLGLLINFNVPALYRGVRRVVL
jgi:GxxExxY protein